MRGHDYEDSLRLAKREFLGWYRKYLLVLSINTFISLFIPSDFPRSDGGRKGLISHKKVRGQGDLPGRCLGDTAAQHCCLLDSSGPRDMGTLKNSTLSTYL